MYHLLKLIRKLSHVLLPICAVLFLLSSRQKNHLPDPNEMLPDLAKVPIQTETPRPPYDFFYGGAEYHITPRADYSIRGMVVSHNNIHAFDDIYHNGNSVDVKDLCVIWGGNVQQSSYQRLDFWSEPWTCNVWTNDRSLLSDFRFDELSNNHLLSQSAAVRSRIQSIHRGDQIEMKGQLINYCPKSHPNQLRRTSLDRNDTGDGACEVLMVDELRVLKANRPGWNQVFTVSKMGFFVFLFLEVLCFLALPILALQRSKAELAERERLAREALMRHQNTE